MKTIVEETTIAYVSLLGSHRALLMYMVRMVQPGSWIEMAISSWCSSLNEVMSREYSALALLAGGHNGAVTVISFSPRARYLATAATDNRICIWEVASRKLLSSYHGNSYAVCLAWLPNDQHPSHLLCGMLDGYVISLQFTPVGSSLARSDHQPHHSLHRQLYLPAG